MMPEDYAKPFTYALSWALITIMAGYLLSNIAFIAHCVPGLNVKSSPTFCEMPSIFGALDHIPTIRRPVQALAQLGNPTRADLVRNIYEFA